MPPSDDITAFAAPLCYRCGCDYYGCYLFCEDIFTIVFRDQTVKTRCCLLIYIISILVYVYMHTYTRPLNIRKTMTFYHRFHLSAYIINGLHVH